MSKKRIFILAALLIVSFGGSFGLSWWLSPSAGPSEDKDAAPPEAAAGPPVQASTFGQPVSLRPDEQQTEKLMKDLRNLIEQNKNTARRLEERARHLVRTEASLKSQAQQLEALRVQLVAPLEGLKQVEKKLESSRIRIRAEELVNLRNTAGAFDGLAPESAAQILVAMVDNSQLEDAVKIFRFMGARQQGKLLDAAAQAGKGGASAAKLIDGLTRVQQDK